MFDVHTPEDYFFHIKRSIEKYQKSKNKSIERLFFIINGLHHLREWIAPNYEFSQPVQNKNQEFFNSIWGLPEFKIVNKLCNGTKHFDNAPTNTKVTYGLPLSEWDSISDVQNFADGPPAGFTLNGVDILVYILKVLDFYEKEWFDKQDGNEQAELK